MSSSIQFPLPEDMKAEIVEKLYHRWESGNVLFHIVSKYKVSKEDSHKLMDIIWKIEKEVTDFRWRIGKIGQ